MWLPVFLIGIQFRLATCFKLKWLENRCFFYGIQFRVAIGLRAGTVHLFAFTIA